MAHAVDTRETAARDAAARPSRKEQAAETRPELEIVGRARRRFARPAITISITVVAVVFGSLAVQVSLIHRQQRLDQIHTEINNLQLANKELSQQEGDLQSPPEILRRAKKFGMVEGKPAELVTPQADTIAALPSTHSPSPTANPPSATTSVPAGG